MRVVEPHHYQTPPAKKSSSKKTRVFTILLVLVLLGTGGFFAKKEFFGKKASVNAEIQSPSPAPEQTVVQTPEPASIDTVKDTLRQFSPNEFRLFYDNLNQPNLEPVANPPSISGNDTADARIRDIAEGRGYKLRHSPLDVTLFVAVDGQRLQMCHRLSPS